MQSTSPPKSLILVVVLPLAFVAASWVLRDAGGPEWIWRHLDPDYFYLLDGLGMANLRPPGHIAHPGVPLSALIGIVLRAAHPLSSGDGLTAAVLADPETHLAIAGWVLTGLIAMTMTWAGCAAWRTWHSLPLALLVQLGPWLSMLTIKYALRVKPEALLVAVILASTALLLTALNQDRLDRHRTRFLIAFAAIAGLGAATKIVAAPALGLMAVFLLARPRTVLAFWVGCVAFTVLFCLPAASEAGRFFDWISLIGKGSGAFGAGPQTGIDPAQWATGFRRMLSRTAVSVPLAVGILTLAWIAWRKRLAQPEARALAGLCLAAVAQAAVAAKQPSGHYMIPVYAFGGLSLALSLRLLTVDVRRAPRVLGVLAVALIVAQTASVKRLHKELADRNRDAVLPHHLLTAPVYAQCAQVSFYPSSSPDFALLLADAVTGHKITAAIAPHIASGRFAVSDWMPGDPIEIRSGDGPVRLETILETYPCTVLRGGHPHRLRDLLASEKQEGLKFDDICRTRFETLYLLGARCP